MKMQDVIKKVHVDEKGRIILPKAVRERLKKKELVIVSDRFGVRIYPKRSLKELIGISETKVGTENLREKEDDPNRMPR